MVLLSNNIILVFLICITNEIGQLDTRQYDSQSINRMSMHIEYDGWMHIYLNGINWEKVFILGGWVLMFHIYF